MKITPGEWMVRGTTVFAGQRLLYDCKAINICVTAEEARANALLIGAAPRLLNELENLLNSISKGTAMEIIESKRQARELLDEIKSGKNEEDL